MPTHLHQRRHTFTTKLKGTLHYILNPTNIQHFLGPRMTHAKPQAHADLILQCRLWTPHHVPQIHADHALSYTQAQATHILYPGLMHAHCFLSPRPMHSASYTAGPCRPHPIPQARAHHVLSWVEPWAHADHILYCRPRQSTSFTAGPCTPHVSPCTPGTCRPHLTLRAHAHHVPQTLADHVLSFTAGPCSPHPVPRAHSCTLHPEPQAHAVRILHCRPSHTSFTAGLCRPNPIPQAHAQHVLSWVEAWAHADHILYCRRMQSTSFRWAMQTTSYTAGPCTPHVSPCTPGTCRPHLTPQAHAHHILYPSFIHTACFTSGHAVHILYPGA